MNRSSGLIDTTGTKDVGNKSYCLSCARTSPQNKIVARVTSILSNRGLHPTVIDPGSTILPKEAKTVMQPASNWETPASSYPALMMDGGLVV